MRISLTPTIRTSSIPSAPAPMKTDSTASQLMATASIGPVPAGWMERSCVPMQASELPPDTGYHIPSHRATRYHPLKTCPEWAGSFTLIKEMFLLIPSFPKPIAKAPHSSTHPVDDLTGEPDEPRFPEELLGHPLLSDPPFAPPLEPNPPSKKEKK